MKELSGHIKEEIGVHAQKQHEKQKKYLGTLEKHNGHIVWQIDLRTQEITAAEYSEEYATIGGGVTRTIIKKDNHWYRSALNKKNAFKKFNQMAKAVIEKTTFNDRANHNREFGG